MGVVVPPARDIIEGAWWPQQDFKFGAQYTGYKRFNGQGTNYDDAGRKASANNSILRYSSLYVLRKRCTH
jgi:hypothetical protein